MYKLSHEEIEAVLMCYDPDAKQAILLSRQKPFDESQQSVVFGRSVQVDPVLTNLLVAAPAMYHALTMQIDFLNSVANSIKLMQANDSFSNSLAEAFEHMKKICEISQKAAREGMEAVVTENASPLPTNVLVFKPRI